MSGMDDDIFEAFIEQLRRYVRERLIPAEEEVIASDHIPDAILNEMRDMGLFGLTIPVEYGGAGMSISQYIETVKQLSYAAPAYRSTVSINIGMTGSAIKNFGTEEQKQQWLPRIASGEIACFGLTEPGSGSDSAAMQTFAARDGNGYRLSGTKRYITNAPHAKIALIMARTSKEALPKNAHVSAFIVDMESAGISVGKPDKKMGQSGAQIADIILDDVKIPGDALVGGEEGRGFQIAMQSLDNGRLSVAGMGVGMGRRILDTAVRYATERKAFGEPIANFQLIQAMLADSEAELYAAECMIADACARADKGEAILRKAAAAKLFSTETCGRVADRCVQIYGGAGYLAEYPAERFFRDARILRIYEGTSQIMQLQIAKHLLREFEREGAVW
ncbi:MAG: acyl-CoA dehydrogenase family protein [Sphingomonadales bacterium]|jgi:acyl-CoA dehydrogenase|uniref:acyl-CoA dehydrogenase family protein n=2 Tax=Sphingorhabdus sp. TaxID=1902408 RepID=UPI003BB1C030|nr:acyl-CoA dehydrogenase family protein [Sphingomonadales bacterium]MBK9432908.1 acyl-CoA dehydrogenase family protein [Sphingomonadales bacterium]